MKTIFRIFVVSLFALWLTTNLISGFKIGGSYQTYLIGAAVLGLMYLFVKPLLKLLFFPINLLTLGVLSWIINVILLYLLTLVVPQVSVSPWHFNGLSYSGFNIPAYDFNQILSFVVTALVLSSVINFLVWLYK